MKDLITIIIILISYTLATIKSHRRVGILGVGALLAVFINLQQITMEKVWSFIAIPVLALVASLELFSLVIRKTGFLDYLASNVCSKLKDPWLIQLFLLIFTYISSMCMNNLAVLILLVPFTIRIATLLGIKDIERLLIFEVIVSNLGGASLLIGDFPNLIIASSTGATFVEFFLNLGLFIVLLLLPLTLWVYFFSRQKRQEKTFDGYKELQKEIGIKILKLQMDKIDFKTACISLALFIIMIIAFIFTSFWKIEPALVGIIFALILIFITSCKEDILNEIDFRTLLTFTCLFIMAGIVQSSGFVSMIKERLSSLSPIGATLLLMWMVGIVTAFLSAGPTTASFLPLAEIVNTMVPNNLAYWTLSLGVLAGSSCSVLSATGGVVTAGLWEKLTNQRFLFIKFIKIGFPIMIVYLSLSTIYIVLRLKIYGY